MTRSTTYKKFHICITTRACIVNFQSSRISKQSTLWKTKRYNHDFASVPLRAADRAAWNGWRKDRGTIIARPRGPTKRCIVPGSIARDRAGTELPARYKQRNVARSVRADCRASIFARAPLCFARYTYDSRYAALVDGPWDVVRGRLKSFTKYFGTTIETVRKSCEINTDCICLKFTFRE